MDTDIYIYEYIYYICICTVYVNVNINFLLRGARAVCWQIDVQPSARYS